MSPGIPEQPDVCYEFILYIWTCTDIHIGSVGKVDIRYCGENQLGQRERISGGLITLNCCVVLCVCVCCGCIIGWHRCAYQMSRGKGIISTITGRSRPAVTTTAWHPFGNCLAPATCRFHKPAIRHRACISQHTL